MKKYLSAAAVMAVLVTASPASALIKRNSYGSHICNDVPFLFQTGIQSLVCLFTEDP
ncbi:hypothetical protein SAMN05518849_11042 [Sphingobium sp. AP50]|jgi:hypothetical protein|uniref:hypothetical protein n=1 Tax=Sphingobium sp. AP50 TaxID=1884369 RepID=UPI0008C15253|nr:hypothetical protein [Sphingobium sp. AP50]SEJ63909.1 hypothetical protein SAMN05518849_11042 [Sphingobium sp. AP50]